jgi:hypothetical protein
MFERMEERKEHNIQDQPIGEAWLRRVVVRLWNSLASLPMGHLFCSSYPW